MTTNNNNTANIAQIAQVASAAIADATDANTTENAAAIKTVCEAAGISGPAWHDHATLIEWALTSLAYVYQRQAKSVAPLAPCHQRATEIMYDLVHALMD